MSPQIAHVPGGKRPLTRIAPRPVPICSTALTVSSPATTTTTSTGTYFRDYNMRQEKLHLRKGGELGLLGLH